MAQRFAANQLYGKLEIRRAAHDDMESSLNSRKSGSSRFTVSGISKVIDMIRNLIIKRI